ncbi:MAG: reverse transcriptase-like protein [Chakrabartia sp.]
MKAARLKIYFDGGCRPNPGTLEVAVVARGVPYFLDNLGQGTNNDAEWLALIHGVEIARRLGAQDFVLLGDSALVINQANGVWKCRGAALQAHYATFKLLSEDMTGLQIRKIGRAQNLAGIALAARHARG